MNSAAQQVTTPDLQDASRQARPGEAVPPGADASALGARPTTFGWSQRRQHPLDASPGEALAVRDRGLFC